MILTSERDALSGFLRQRPLFDAWLTVLVGLVGGGGFFLLNLPLPWILGSVFSTALVSAAGIPLGLPKRWRGYAMVVIGTMVGGGFTQDVIGMAGQWLPSILAMLMLSVLFQRIAYVLFRRFTDMSPQTALLASVPGGLSVVTSLADALGQDVRRIALAHSARLIVLLALAPLLIHLVSDFDLADANHMLFASSEPFVPLDFAKLVVLAVISWWIARKLRFPSALMVVPLCVSAVAHSTGVVSAHVPMPLAILAQLVVGANVGVRFHGYRLKDILNDGKLAAVIGVCLAVISLIAAVAMSRIMNLPVAELLLAYLPGGAPELSVVAVTLNLNPPFIAAHHVLRMMFISIALPIVSKRMGADDPE